ncbi:MAG: NAD-dependent epimerase/dehydratase family protein [Prevotellaceae bacterium]|nr:NAD-dependent epimerase/dehydratase family protein [Prevotellaceae bacterium]
MKNILVIGAGGQIGTELVPHLQRLYGEDHVVAADVKPETCHSLRAMAITEQFDALDINIYAQIVKKYRIDSIFNLVALLSATGEKIPQLAWEINMGALLNSLEIAKENGCALFTPSSIGAFGHSTPHQQTPQDTVMRPGTIYGVCKVAGELLSDYYFTRFGVDTRSVRFPGIISNGALPGGGTTDYAVEIFYQAIKNKRFTCPLPADSYLDMLYMPDALNACSQLMEADPAKLIHRNSFNVTAMSFCPSDLYDDMIKRIPEFTMDYQINPVMREIAASWPDSMDDSCARNEWGWNPVWDRQMMVDDMLQAIRIKLSVK